MATIRPADKLIAGDYFDQDCLSVAMVFLFVTNYLPQVVVGELAEDAELGKTEGICSHEGRQSTAAKPSL